MKTLSKMISGRYIAVEAIFSQW